MITRIWRGWTRPEQADAYQQLLLTEIFPEIAARDIRGYRGIQLLRRETAGEVEFVTIMWFDSLDDIRTFSGADYETAVVMQRAGHTCSRQVAPLDLRDTSFLRKQVPDAIRRSARAVSGGDAGCPNGRPFLHARVSRKRRDERAVADLVLRPRSAFPFPSKRPAHPPLPSVSEIGRAHV